MAAGTQPDTNRLVRCQIIQDGLNCQNLWTRLWLMMKLSIHALMAVALLSPMTSASLLADPVDAPVALPAQKPSVNYLHRPEVRAFLDELSQSSGLDRNRLAGIMSRATQQQTVLDAISRPAEGTLTWGQYRPIFLKQKRIDQGREFLLEHAELLERAVSAAPRTAPVPPQLGVATIAANKMNGRLGHGVTIRSHSAVRCLGYGQPSGPSPDGQ